MKHVVILGGGAALAQPVIRHYLEDSKVTAIIARTLPKEGVYSEGTNHFRIVTSHTQVEGKIDTLITFPGYTANNLISTMSDDQWDLVLDRTLSSVFRCFHDLAPYFNDGANIVAVGSIMGSLGGKGCSNYAAAKAGLVGLVRAAANEWAPRDIKVNLLELGYIDSGMGARLEPTIKERVLPTIPLKRFGTEDDVVLAIDYLANVNYMTGNILTLAGGLR